MDDGAELEARLREMARFFYALKDPLRLRILLTLVRDGKIAVTELAHAMRVSQPLVSWHLARLRAAELVRVERDGRIALYSAALDTFDQEIAAFRALLQTTSKDPEHTQE